MGERTVSIKTPKGFRSGKNLKIRSDTGRLGHLSFPRFFLPAALLFCLASCGHGDSSEETLPSQAPQTWWPYAAIAWSGTHHDPSNSDYVRYDPGPRFMEPYTRLNEVQGDAIFTGMTVDDLHDRIYVPTGQSNQPNLHAFDLEGVLQWTSDDWDTSPWDPDHRLDSGAVSGAPIVDDQGFLYLSDSQYLWRSDRNGNLKGMYPLPREQNGRSYPIITPFFTRTGQVGGVTAAGRVVIFDRESGGPLQGGELLLPGIMKPPVDEGFSIPALLMNCFLWNTCDPANPYMLDPDLIAQVGQAFLGVGMPVTNTPAVLPDPADPQLTRVFVPALLEPDVPDGPVSVRLFRVDVTFQKRNRVIIHVKDDFGGLMKDGEGSATSPTLSTDGSTVYVGDNRGVLYAFDSNSGEERWRAPGVGNMLGSTTASRDTGAIYVATDTLLKVLSPEGVILLERSYDELAVNGPWVPPIDTDGDGQEDFTRAAMPAGLAVTSPNRVLLPLVLGYRLSQDNGRALWPVQTVLAALNRDGTWEEDEVYPMPDVVETTVCTDQNGNLYVAHASSLSSIFSSLYCKLNLSRFVTLPPPVEPKGGLTILKTADLSSAPGSAGR